MLLLIVNCNIVDAIVKQNNMFGIGFNDDDFIYLFVWKIIESLIMVSVHLHVSFSWSDFDHVLIQVINDLLDPVGQNLRVREDAQGTYVEGIKEEVVLSPAHCLSLIATGEGIYNVIYSE